MHRLVATVCEHMCSEDSMPIRVVRLLFQASIIYTACLNRISRAADLSRPSVQAAAKDAPDFLSYRIGKKFGAFLELSS
jgi:hypothetical protein